MPCDPDLADQVLADAARLGGPTFVAAVRADAHAVADELAPLGAAGAEPPHRWSAWTGAAWALVDARRAELVGTSVPRRPAGHGPSPRPAARRATRCGRAGRW